MKSKIPYIVAMSLLLCNTGKMLAMNIEELNEVLLNAAMTMSIEDAIDRTQAAINEGANINTTTVRLLRVPGFLNILGGGPDSLIPQGSCALHIAVKRKSLPLAQMLIDNGIDINMLDSQGNSALSLAVSQQNPDIVQALVNANNPDDSQKLDPNSIDAQANQLVQLQETTGLTPKQKAILAMISRSPLW